VSHGYVHGSPDGSEAVCDYFNELRMAGIAGSSFAFATAIIRMYWRYRMDKEKQQSQRLLEKQRQSTAIVLSRLRCPVALRSDGSIKTEVGSLQLEPVDGLKEAGCS
jgi:hypothetical protein